MGTYRALALPLTNPDMKDELLRLAFHVAHDFSRISIFMIAVKLVVPNG